MRAALRDSVLFEGPVNGVTFRRENPTESYVVIPPALVITDDAGAMWTLGTEYLQPPSGLEFNVVRNGVSTGEFARNIEYRRGHGVYIYGRAGRRHWTGKSFV